MKVKLLIALCGALALSGCSKLNKENYDKLEMGMSQKEVEAILGSADNCVEKTLHTNCVWGDESKNIEITLVSDKVTIYSKHGITQ